MTARAFEFITKSHISFANSLSKDHVRSVRLTCWIPSEVSSPQYYLSMYIQQQCMYVVNRQAKVLGQCHLCV